MRPAWYLAVFASLTLALCAAEPQRDGRGGRGARQPPGGRLRGRAAQGRAADRVPTTMLGMNTQWTSADSPRRITGRNAVPDGGSLNIEAGVVLLFSEGASLTTNGGRIEIAGDPDNPARLLSENGHSNWEGVTVSGDRGTLIVRNALIANGRLEASAGATLLIEDSLLRDFIKDTVPIIHTLRAASLTVRRVHVRHYYELLSQQTPTLIEDSLFEDISGDGIDLDAAPPGSVIRRSTVHNGNATNVDGIDLGFLVGARGPSPSSGVLVENNLIYDFPEDKGVSIGEGATDITVRGNVIHGVDAGIAVKDSSSATIANNTIVGAKFGIHLYEKVKGKGGGTAETYNNLIWNADSGVEADELSRVSVEFSDLPRGAIREGRGNVSAEPEFVNATDGNYGLKSGSALIAAGRDGADIGAPPGAGVQTAVGIRGDGDPQSD